MNAHYICCICFGVKIQFLWIRPDNTVLFYVLYELFIKSLSVLHFYPLNFYSLSGSMHCWIESKKIPIQKGFGVDVGQVARSLFDKRLSACAVYILCVQHPVFIRSWNVYLTTAPQAIESWNPVLHHRICPDSPTARAVTTAAQQASGVTGQGELNMRGHISFLILLSSRSISWWKSLVLLL